MAPPPAKGAKKLTPYEARLIKDGWKAMKSWTSTPTENGWVLKGKCPNCEHDASKSIPAEVTTMGSKAMEVQAETGEYAVQCNCSEPHPDPPEGESGCGAYWGIKVAHEEDASVDQDPEEDQ